MLSHILVTPARNEEEFIELTIRSVINQSVRPVHWLIVSDGSTDRTDEIAESYAKSFDWITLYRMPKRETRDFGGKARCFNSGYESIKHLPHDLVCSLDADITFTPDYFEFLIEKFIQNPKLGLAGTPFSENGQVYDYRFASIEHVSGACQIFRRECFATIGGYTPMPGGGIDVVAVLSCRMHGWTTRTFTEKTCEHHRPMGTGNDKNRFIVNYKLGQRCYRLGFHPLWQTLRSFYQLTRKPYLVGGIALFVGFWFAWFQHKPRPISEDLVRFQQRDQLHRLRNFVGLNRASTTTPN